MQVLLSLYATLVHTRFLFLPPCFVPLFLPFFSSFLPLLPFLLSSSLPYLFGFCFSLGLFILKKGFTSLGLPFNLQQSCFIFLGSETEDVHHCTCLIPCFHDLFLFHFQDPYTNVNPETPYNKNWTELWPVGGPCLITNS